MKWRNKFLAVFSMWVLIAAQAFVIQPQAAEAQAQFNQTYGKVSSAACTATAGQTKVSTTTPCGGLTGMLENSNITVHSVSWVTVATTSACTLELETSSDGVTYVLMSGSAIQTCTSSGAYTFVGGAAKYVRMNLLSLTTTGSGGVTIRYAGNVRPVPVGSVTNCGVSNSCATPVSVPNLRFVYGTCTASSATTCAQTGIAPAFTSSSSYFCTLSDATTANAFKITYVSSSAFTITTASSSDVFNWICWGT